jgi:DNA invertase Pin-like site-specific DNA recombinase
MLVPPKMGAIVMTNIAYSYMRFSNPQQASGDSRRRQLAMAEKYAAEHNLTLDKHLSFRDLGVSAFRSKNAKDGALRAFLEAIEHHLVPWGSHLLIESLDRLSRDRILAAQTLFLQIIQAGVIIVTLTDQRSYSLESINQNPLDLIVSLVVMMRANEESEMKSRRIRAAFDVMRSKLAEKPWTARCPGWLRLDKEAGKFIIVEERAEIVRRIFRESLEGIGRETIARRLNEERVPLFGQGNQRDKLWQRSLIRHLLYSPSVIGTLVPFISEWTDGVQRFRPQTPVENYFPAIISQADWDRIQAKRAAWSAHHRCDVPKDGRGNLLAFLSRCPFCDRPMVLLAAGGPNWRYYQCRRAFSGTGCSDRWVRYPGIEDALTIDIGEVIKSCPKPALTSDARKHHLTQIRARLHVLRERRKSMISEHTQLRLSSRPVLAARESVDSEIDRLLAERKRLRITRPKWLDVTLTARLEKLRAVATTYPLDRKEIHLMFRSLFVKVIVDWENDRLVFHWQHGGESSVGVNMKPQRRVANPRRADRPRYQPGERALPLPEVAR